ncbi:hypothetical protein [Clostridium sp. YIM B02555]|uniref:hypothetical protein n=1 Tax=Clostridium sp. YIM B02555 TaxID=2911968 RepID=UPI001EED3321|nr:hypothetical protein [Clostridium sp. YIM B02555]
MDITRKTEVYRLLIEKEVLDAEQENYKYYEELIDPGNILTNVLEYYFDNYIHTSYNDKKVTLKASNICYYMHSADKDANVRKVKLNYIKFNKNTKVVDINSLTSRYKKDRDEGDEEYQHYVVKTYDNTNKAVLVFERIGGAVTIGMLKANLRKAYKEWVRSNFSTDEQKDEKQRLLRYNINIKIVPSPDFVSELEKFDKVSLLKVTVDKESVTNDEDIKFSEENISRDDVDIIYRPFSGLSFSKFKIKKYFELFEKQSNKTKIKRIVINGRKDGNGISLDTEQMKLSKFIKTQVDTEGFVDSEKIFEKYEDLINKDFKEYFNNIFIDINEEEE